MNNNLRVAVIGPVGRGKSHVMHTIEKALVLEYGELIQIKSDDLVDERRNVGVDISSWQRPLCEEITLHEMTDGQLSQPRYKFEIIPGAQVPKPTRLLISMIEEYLVSVSVCKSDSGPRVILCVSAPHSVLDDIVHLWSRNNGKVFGNDGRFQLEDVGMTGTLFATRIAGTITHLNCLTRLSDDVGDLNPTRELSFALEYK